MADVGRVLRGNDDGGDFGGLAVHVADGDLRFGVRTEPRGFAAFANLGEIAAEAVGKHDGGGHEFRRVVAGKPEHQPLVTRALFGGLFAPGLGGVDALRDVLALLRDGLGDENFVRVKNIIIVDVANAADGVADDAFKVELRVGGDFAGEDDHVAFDECFGGHAAAFVLREAGVEDRVGNGVAHFVGVAFANRFGGKNIVRGHWSWMVDTRKIQLSRLIYQHIMIF